MMNQPFRLTVIINALMILPAARFVNLVNFTAKSDSQIPLI